MLKKLKYFPVETLSKYKFLNKEYMGKTKKLSKDKNVYWHKKLFYAKLAFIDMLRSMKNIVKSLAGK